MTKVGSGGVGTTLVLALLLVVVSLAAGVGFTYLIWNPTTIVKPPPIVLGIQKLNELATVKQTVQAIVIKEENEKIFSQPLPEFLTGEKLLLVAVGDVEAGVNLDELDKEDVQVDGKKVIINLPDAEILDSSLNEGQTNLYDRDRGLLKPRGNDELIEQARQDALTEIEEEAKKNGIIEQAQNNAKDSIRALMITSGYKKVVFQ